MADNNRSKYNKLIPITELLTEKQQSQAIDLAIKGVSTIKIAQHIGTTQYLFWEYRNNVPLFSNRYNAARIEGLESIGDDLLTINERYQDPQQARIYSDNAKWLMSKRHSAKYGDKLDVNLTQTVDLSGALAAARDRASLPQRDVTPALPEAVMHVELPKPEIEQEPDDTHGLTLDELLK